MGIKTTEGLVIDSGDYVVVLVRRGGDEAPTKEVRYVIDTIDADDEENGNGDYDQVIVCDADSVEEHAGLETISIDDVWGCYLREDQARVAAGEVAS